MLRCFHCGKIQPDENFDNFVCDCSAWDEYRRDKRESIVIAADVVGDTKVIEDLVEKASVLKFECDFPYTHDGWPACECMWKKRIKWAIERAVQYTKGDSHV